MPVADFAQGVKSPFFSMVNHTNDGARAKLASKATSTSVAQTTSASPAKTAAAGDGDSFLDNVLDVVNPLQHLPVVGTIYRAMTGDKIGDVEKVAGDTLYGGPIGLVSSLADLAFEKITGKNFGDTMLAMVGIGDKDTALAANTPKPGVTKPDDIQAELVKTAALNKASLIQTPATKIAQAASAPVQSTPAVAVATKPPQTMAPQTMANVTTPSIVDISPQTDAMLSALQKNGVTGAMQSQAMDAYRRTMTMNAQTADAH